MSLPNLYQAQYVSISTIFYKMNCIQHIAEIEQEYIENRNITLLKQLKQTLHILETRSNTTFWKQSLWYTNS